jgi:exopolysaccharide biosynthesis polyprenyl glycosylphosphotransferase
VRGVSYAIGIAAAICLYGQAQLTWLILLSGIAVTMLLVLQRNVSHRMTRWAYQRGYGIQRVVIYGQESYSQIEQLLANSPHLGKACVGFVHDIGCMPPTLVGEAPGALGPWSELDTITKEHDAAEVLVHQQSISQNRLSDIVRDCERLNIRLSLMLDGLNRLNCEVNYELLGNILIARYGAPGKSSTSSVLKRAIDVAGSSVLLVLLSPLFLFTAILVRLDSKGPVFFRHERVGQDGRRFSLWKFRSMRVHTSAYERSPASNSDLRLTRVGRVLRRLSIDELPQLINVLRGDMSLVGPRPEMAFIVQRYGPLEQRRLKAKPGITGLWQISPARAMPIHENMEFDLFYIEHQNMFLDCAILLRTIAAVIRGLGAT